MAKSLVRPNVRRRAWHGLWAGELTLEHLRALESHLDECAACSALIAITPPTPALLARRPAIPPRMSIRPTFGTCGCTSLLADSDGSPTIDMIEPESPAGTLPPSTIGDYELLERIGRGGMGIVFRARQVRLDRIVAVKTLHARTNQSPEAVERLIIEAKRLAQVRHPNIVQVIDVGEQDGVPFFSMELVEGTTVARAAARAPRGRRGARPCSRRKSPTPCTPRTKPASSIGISSLRMCCSPPATSRKSPILAWR